MNNKIDLTTHIWLESNTKYREYIYGSRMLGNSTEDSDYDYIRIFNEEDLKFSSLGKYLPNIHALQYTENQNYQYVWMTDRQFWQIFFTGDGSMLIDLVLFNDEFYIKECTEEKLNLCYTYKVIKGLLGITRRDLKKHKIWEKRIRYSKKSLYMAECLLDYTLPKLEIIKDILSSPVETSDKIIKELQLKENNLRSILNKKIESNELTYYPIFKESNEALTIVVQSNNIKEFRYE